MNRVMAKAISMVLAAGMLMSPSAAFADGESVSTEVVSVTETISVDSAPDGMEETDASAAELMDESATATESEEETEESGQKNTESCISDPTENEKTESDAAAGPVQEEKAEKENVLSEATGAGNEEQKRTESVPDEAATEKDTPEQHEYTDSSDGSDKPVEANPVEEKPAEEKAVEEKPAENGKKDAYGISPEKVKDIDFSSGRILVGTSDPSVFRKDDLILSSYENLYLLSFPDAAGAKEAYCYYTGKADFVDADIEFTAASQIDPGDDGSWMVQDDAISQLAELTEGGTPDVKKRDRVIALVDTGTSEDPHVIERVSVIGDNPGDDNGHGSQMLGIITEQFPDARVISIKALDAKAKGSTSSIYAAIQYAIERGVSVINLSLSAYSTEENAALTEAVRQAADAGIYVVGAAGNKGRDVRYYTPGNIAGAVIVGSCGADGQRLENSNYGDTVDYNVRSASTSEAAAIMSAYIASHMESDGSVKLSVNKNGIIYSTDYEKPTEEEQDAGSGESMTDHDGTEMESDEAPGDTAPSSGEMDESNPEGETEDNFDDPEETDPEILEGPGYPYGTVFGDKDDGEEASFSSGEVQDEVNGEFSAAAELSISSNTGWKAYFTENPEGSRERTENLHQMGSTRIYCMDGGLHFQPGTAEKTTMSAAGWTEARTKKAALAWYYILNVSKADITKLQKQQIFQTLLWNLQSGELSKYVYTTDPPKKTYNAVVNAFDTWYSSNKNYYDYTATFYKTKGTTGNQPLATFTVTPKIYMYLKKTSSTTATNNNNSYSLKGAVYGVYSDAACTKQVKTLTTAENGESQTVEIASAGTYYVKEKTASTGYLLDTAVHTVKVTASNSHSKPATISVTEIPKTYLYLEKVSGGSTASLAGAVYGVYSDAACTKSVATLTTTANGNSNTIQVSIGSYYIKETKAPAGYSLDPVVRGVIVTAEHVAGNPAKVTSTEPSDAYVCLKKESSNPSVSSNTSLYSLSGAVYGVYSDQACTKEVLSLTTKADGSSDAVKIAIGTYYVKEKTAPKGYKLNTGVITVSVTAANGSGNPAVINASDEPIPSDPPEIRTSAAFSDGTKYLDASKTKSATIRDTVTYKGLMPKTTYTVTGTVYDAVTKQPTQLTASAEFTTGDADSGKFTSSGTVEVSFSIPDVQPYKNHTLVVTEILTQGTTEIARHFDLSDGEQTVYIIDSGKKEISQVSNSIGEVHTWTVTNTIPDGISGNEAKSKYEVKDEIDGRLDYAGNLKAEAKKADGTVVELSQGTDYTLSQPAVGKAGGSWIVAMTQAGLAKLGTAPWGTTVITFDTKINITAVAATDIPNQSVLDFNNMSFATNEVYVYTGDVEARKVDADTGNPLEGTVFGLYLDEACTSAFQRDGKDYQVTSGSDGYAKFHGLKDGTYYIREMKAAKNHELLKESFAVTVEEGKCTAESITVSNQAKIVLQTGGAGRRDIYLAALAAVLAALVTGSVLTVNRRKRKA